MASRIAATAKHLVRTMSTTTAPAKFEFLVIVPDKPGTLQKRLEVRAYVYPSALSQLTSRIKLTKLISAHLSAAKVQVEDGTYTMGGETHIPNHLHHMWPADK